MNTIIRTGNYGLTAFEYAGMLSYSYIRRGGLALITGMEKIYPPIQRVTAAPFIYCGQKIGRLGKMFTRNHVIEERLMAIDEKLNRIDRRLADMEKTGIRTIVETQQLAREKKKLNEGKKMLLQAIVSENMQLRQQPDGVK